MSLIALCLWVVVAWFLMISLTARQSWPAAYGLMGLGLPIVAWLGYEGGWLWALLGLGVMAAVLRWPLIYGLRWVREKFR